MGRSPSFADFLRDLSEERKARKGAEEKSAKLREALAPFADAAAFMDDDWGDSEHLVELPMGDGKVYCVFVSTFRNARAALTKGTTTTGGGNG